MKLIMSYSVLKYVFICSATFSFVYVIWDLFIPSDVGNHSDLK